MPSRMRLAQVGRAGYFSRWPDVIATPQGVAVSVQSLGMTEEDQAAA
jgi:hypothetical protein